MVAQIERLTVQVGPIEAQVEKRGQGEPLLYLHGAFAYGGWPGFLESLAESYTVYAPLHPGFGEGDGLSHLDDVLDLALYSYDLMDALGLETANVVGHFFGAMIAAEMAAICPHRVDKLVLAAPAGLWLEADSGVDFFATPINELRSILFADGDSAVAKQTMPDAANDDERGEQSLARVRSLSAVGKFLWPLPDRGLKKRLGRIKAPTLVVVGDGDKIIPPAYGDAFVERIPGARLEVFTNSGHLLYIERGDDFASLVSGFLG